MERQYPIHWQRMQGVAAAIGVEPDDDSYDLAFLGLHVDHPAFACSAVYYPPSTTATGHGYLSRNYDFFVGNMADLMQVPLPPGAELPPVMSEPYLMEWHPTDGGYASWAIHAFDTLAGTLDGFNSAGLVVSILADNEAMDQLGAHFEPHPGRTQIVGLHELAVMRFLLDTCATVAEAKDTLLTVKQYYRFMPLHYIVADRDGHSFVYENSVGRNVQYVIEGDGIPQVVTNFQLSQHPTLDAMPGGTLTEENEAFWRYREVSQRIAAHEGAFTEEEMKTTLACVNVLHGISTTDVDSPLREVTTRTVWHTLYDQHAGTVEASFYLGEDVQPVGTRVERRSDYLTFALDTSAAT